MGSEMCIRDRQVELGSIDNDELHNWRSFLAGGSFSFDSVFCSFVSLVFSEHWMSSLKVTQDVFLEGQLSFLAPFNTKRQDKKA